MALWFRQKRDISLCQFIYTQSLKTRYLSNCLLFFWLISPVSPVRPVCSIRPFTLFFCSHYYALLHLFTLLTPTCILWRSYPRLPYSPYSPYLFYLSCSPSSLSPPVCCFRMRSVLFVLIVWGFTTLPRHSATAPLRHCITAPLRHSVSLSASLPLCLSAPLLCSLSSRAIRHFNLQLLLGF